MADVSPPLGANMNSSYAPVSQEKPGEIIVSPVQNSSRRKRHRPLIARLPVLLVLFVISVALIGVVQWAIKVLPAVDKKGTIESVISKRDEVDWRSFGAKYHPRDAPAPARVVQARQEEDPPNPQFSPDPTDFFEPGDPDIPTPDPIVSPDPPTPNPVTSFSPNPTDFFEPGDPDAPTPVEPSDPIVTPGPDNPNPNPDTPGTPGTPDTPDTPGDPGENNAVITFLSEGQPPPTGDVVIGPPSTMVVQQSDGSVLTTVVTPVLGPAGTTATPGAPAPTDFFESGDSGAGSIPQIAKIITKADYFAGAYLATILAVLFAIPFSILESTCKKLEPFEQLCDEDGAEAKSTLFANYAVNRLTAPFIAMGRGHWIVFVSAIISFASLLIIPLTPEAFYIRTKGNCSMGCRTGYMSVSLPAARALQGCLVLIACMLISLIVLLRRRKDRPFSDPLSIAGTAVLCHDLQVLEQIHPANIVMNDRDLKERIGSNRYKLSLGIYPDGSERFGLTQVLGLDMVPERSVRMDGAFPTEQGWTHHLVRPHRLTAALFMIPLFGMAVLIVFYYFNKELSSFELFMRSQSFGVRFLFTALGVLVKLFWSTILESVTLLEPYRQMCHGGALAHSSILVSPPNSAFGAVSTALAHRHWTVLAVALTTILAEALTVTLASIPFNNALAWPAFQACTWLSVAIIVAMLACLVLVCLHRQPALPVKPDTIAGQLYYLAGSHVLNVVSDLSTTDTSSRDRQIKERGYVYGFGHHTGTDGLARVGVNLQQYIHS